MATPEPRDPALKETMNQLVRIFDGLFRANRIIEVDQLLGQVLTLIDQALGGSEGDGERRLVDVFGRPYQYDNPDWEYLWAFVRSVLAHSSELRARRASEITTLLRTPTCPPIIGLSLLDMSEREIVVRHLGDVLDQIDHERDLAIRHAAYQKLAHVFVDFEADHPPLMRRRHASYAGLVRALGAEIPPCAPPAASVAPVGRIVFLVLGLNSPLHSPTRLALLYASQLRKRGVEVAIAQCSPGDDPPPSRNPDVQAVIEELRRQRIQFIEPNMELPRVEQLRITIDAVRAFAPDAMVSVGATEALEKGLLAREFPLLEMSLGKGSFFRYHPSDAQFAGVSFAAAEAEAEAAGFDPEWCDRFMTHAGALDFRSPGPALRRGDLGLPADVVIGVTVGNSLTRVIDDGYLDFIAEQLDREPRLHWLVVGPGIPARIERMATDKYRGRISWIKYHPDLPRLFGTLDLYLNPFDQRGGGFAAVDALICNLPVLALDVPGSDVVHLIGQAFAQADKAAYAASLRRFVADPVAGRSQAAAALDDLKGRRSTAAAVQHLLETLGTVRREMKEKPWRRALI